MSSMESIQGSELWFKALGVAAAAVLNKKGCVIKLCFLLIKKGDVWKRKTSQLHLGGFSRKQEQCLMHWPKQLESASLWPS